MVCCAADVVVECVMDTLLGGGSSFSAGGPGKGMYSRLYRVRHAVCALLPPGHLPPLVIVTCDGGLCVPHRRC